MMIMKFTINKSDFKNMMADLKQPSKINPNCCLVFNTDKITCIINNEFNELRSSVNTFINLKNKIHVITEFNKINNILNIIDDDFIDISITNKNITIISRIGTCVFPIIQSQFNQISLDKNPIFILDIIDTVYIDLVDKLNVCIAQDDYYNTSLTNILINICNDHINFISSDGKCINKSKLYTMSKTTKDLLLTKQCVNTIKSILSNTNDVLSIAIYDNKIAFKYKNTAGIFQQTSGSFPNIDKVENINYTKKITIIPNELKPGLNLASVLSNDPIKTCRFYLSKKRCYIKPLNITKETESIIDFNTSWNYNDYNIKVPINVLLKILNQFDNDTQIHISDNPKNPIKIENDNCKYYLLPLIDR